MKVLDITTFFHPQSGGIKRYLLEKAKFFEYTSYKHILIIPGKELRKYNLHKTTVYELPSILIPKTGGYRIFKNFSKIREVIEDENPDIVEIEGSYFLVPFLKSSKYKLVIFYHSEIENYLKVINLPFFNRGKLVLYLIKKFLKSADLIITPAQKLEEKLKNNGVERVKTINLGIDPDIFKFKGQTDKTERDKFRVLYVGRLSPEKRIKLMVELFLNLPTDRYEIWIAGEGPERKRILKLIKKRAEVKFLGYLSEPDSIANLYNQGDFLINTSEQETFGLTFLEAQACGCILIAKDMELETQPFKEFLVKDTNLESFYNALEIASKSLSFSLKVRISSYIHNRFSWKQTFKELINTYKNLLGSILKNCV